MKRFVNLLLAMFVVPVFFSYGPNAVGYETIVETQLDDMNIKLGSVIACNVNVEEYHRHQLVEGVLLTKADPLLMLVQTPLGVMPLTVPHSMIEFCLMNGEQMK